MKTAILITPLLLLQTWAWSQTLQVHGNFALQNLHTGQFLGVRETAATLSGERTDWALQPADAGGYTLKSLSTGRTLQPKRGRIKAGTALEEQTPDGSAAQQYELIAAEGGQCWIRVKGTELYLTPSKTGVELQPWQDGDAQRWKLVSK